MMRGRQTASQGAHNPRQVGSTPTPAIPSGACSACNGARMTFAGTIKVDNPWEPATATADRWVICRPCKGTGVAKAAA